MHSLLTIMLAAACTVVALSATAHGGVDPGVPPPLSAADDAAIRQILRSDTAPGPRNSHVSPALDWENAFGIRFHDLSKLDAFYAAIVKPLQIHNTREVLEVKVRSVTPDVAVADRYWHEAGQLDVETRRPGPDRWGRTTFVFTRTKGGWTEVLERVADLRLAYFRHYDSLPGAAPLPAATLAQYAGVYAATEDHETRIVAVEGDHLTLNLSGKKRVAIPVSATDFLLFDPDDLAEYSKLHFMADGQMITVADETGKTRRTLVKTK